MRNLKEILDGCVAEIQMRREQEARSWEALTDGLGAARAIIDDRPIGAYAIILAVSKDLEFDLMGDVDATDPILKAIEEASDVSLGNLEDLIELTTREAFDEDEGDES